ncbi:hypothetical protein NAL32_20980 [Chryseobacterium sp. Ch-15]|uniref:Uncharacterized protein n=1 Tax=Chryseobacterium muglaense TaxID=2893752 RepID=A0A9Q3V0R8_9FLAO|nr:hypothetical protein [Chryseobacterium muglaense]MBD3906404.1 hypothetical protein [Chryseobacterium muglaense]MCC9037095.1 hypothetical protein [Chryseobacterium muglaense]MCM2556866.1 hypothetical protein [Chryseobacterium muglaense]
MIQYPIFVLQKGDDIIYVFSNEKYLKSTNTEIFEKLDYKDTVHIDSLGNKYKIDKAFKVKNIGLFGFNPLLKGKQILIDFEYESEVEKITLDDFKKDILARVDKTKKIWKSAWDIEELKNAISNSQSFEEIAVLLK